MENLAEPEAPASGSKAACRSEAATSAARLRWSKPVLRFLDLNAALNGGARFASDHSAFTDS